VASSITSDILSIEESILSLNLSITESAIPVLAAPVIISEVYADATASSKSFEVLK